MEKIRNILICPLDWGLGHATRCVPVVEKFIEAGANVIIAADGRPLAFLKEQFPSLQFIQFAGYNVRYPEKGSMVFKMLLSAPTILNGIRKEHNQLKKIIAEHKIDMVVSDNRFGLWNKEIKSVFITHQLCVKCPGWLKFVEYFIFRLNRFFINKYDECWVPDFRKKSKLSGSLTAKHRRFKNVHFIGALSRFNKPQYFEQKAEMLYDIVFVLSGPEPQRTVFENIILTQLKTYDNLKILIVQGITETNETKTISDNVEMVSHLSTSGLAKAMQQSRLVICRPGYSSIMDLVTLGVKAFFVPTPGQTEQEYLARYYHKRNMFWSAKQQGFDIMKAIEKSVFFKGITLRNEHDRLSERIHIMID